MARFRSPSYDNTLQDGQRWKWLPKAPQRRRAFNKYLEKYGPAWVNFEKGTDSLRARLKTPKEYAECSKNPVDSTSCRAKRSLLNTKANPFTSMPPTSKGWF